ncbi:MAG: hypothetical protein QXK32_04765 [Candidatus Jordarchaeales archaeon]
MKYRLHGCVEEACYSSEALRRILGGGVLLLVPESLAGNLDYFKRRVEERG